MKSLYENLTLHEIEEGAPFRQINPQIISITLSRMSPCRWYNQGEVYII